MKSVIAKFQFNSIQLEGLPKMKRLFKQMPKDLIDLGAFFMVRRFPLRLFSTSPCCETHP